MERTTSVDGFCHRRVFWFALGATALLLSFAVRW